jgi:cytochrome c peroxidase
MAPKQSAEESPRRKGYASAKRPRSHTRLTVAGYAMIAAAFPLLIGAPARSQTMPGQPAIAHQSAAAPELQILLGETPATIPQTISFLDGTGSIGTYFPDGAQTTAGNPFFDTALTTNGRSCFTCHIPQGGWTISPPQINAAYVDTAGKSPIFQPIDSANCPDTTGAAGPAGPKFLTARSLLFNRGDFRIAINGPNPLGPQSGSTFTTFEGDTPSAFNSSTAVPQWILTVKNDPTGCENDPKYGLKANMVSVYRRTMPSANVAFLDPGGRGPTLFNIMWDSREPTLENQFMDATEFHGQTTVAPTSQEQTEGADFQLGTFAGQILDFVAGDLTGADGSGALGGPQNLYESRLNVPVAPFAGGCFDTPIEELVPGLCPGILDPSSLPGAGIGFDLYTAFADSTSRIPGQAAKRQSIARGEAIFNTRTFTINDVAGLDDVLNGSLPTNPPGGSNSKIAGVCATCHNNENLGNDNFLDPKREGIMDNSNNTNNALPPSSDFPLFAFYCPAGSIPFFSNQVTSSYCQDLPGSPATCDEFDTTDPGLGLADGECEDLGKMKVPVLHNLAARAPYFHGGNAATLADLVNFYNTRFSIGLSAQDKTDLVNFLNSL